jgi:hypothetical protein
LAVRGQAVSEYRSELYDIVGALSLLHACYAIHDYKYMSFLQHGNNRQLTSCLYVLLCRNSKLLWECEVIDDISVTLVVNRGHGSRQGECMHLHACILIHKY